MSDVEFDTGNEQLNVDLARLLEICSDDNRLADVKNALADESLSGEQLADVFPSAVWGLAVALRIPSRYQELAELVHESARTRIREAKSIVDEQLADLFKHPAFLEHATQRSADVTGSSDEDENVFQGSLRTISGLGRLSTWIGPSPKFRPAVRVMFLDKRGKLLLDSTLDWDDLLFVGEGLLKIVADEFEEGKHLAEHLDFSSSDKRKMGERIERAESVVRDIKNLSRVYEFRPEANGGTETDDSSATE